jgi:hypothetical protein
MPRRRNRVAQLPVIESNAAGIDVGATQVFVAVPADRDPESIRSFDTFTVELEKLADWLQQGGFKPWSRNCIPSAFCVDPFVRMMKSAPSVHCGGTATT